MKITAKILNDLKIKVFLVALCLLAFCPNLKTQSVFTYDLKKDIVIGGLSNSLLVLLKL
jgi:hypothetical protein